jgi:hypothetical protein
MRRYDIEGYDFEIDQSVDGDWVDWDDVQSLQTRFTLAMLLLRNVTNVDGDVSDVLLNEINKFMEEATN